MPVINTSLPPYSLTASFHLWGRAFSDALTTFGILRTGDTGQINWDSAGSFSTTSTNTYAGYEIRRFGDALQTQNPVFLRISYGVGQSTYAPGIELSFGTGSNGNGVLTGRPTNETFQFHGVNSHTASYACTFSGSNNRFATALFHNAGGYSMFLSIERTKNSSGQDTDEGLLVYISGATSSSAIRKQSIFVPKVSDGNLALVPDSNIFIPLIGGSGLDSVTQTVGIYPNHFFRGGNILLPGINHFGYYFNDFIPGSIADIMMYGVSRKYLFLPNNSFINNQSRGNVNSALCLAILHE